MVVVAEPVKCRRGSMDRQVLGLLVGDRGSSGIREAEKGAECC